MELVSSDIVTYQTLTMFRRHYFQSAYPAPSACPAPSAYPAPSAHPQCALIL